MRFLFCSGCLLLVAGFVGGLIVGRYLEGMFFMIFGIGMMLFALPAVWVMKVKHEHFHNRSDDDDDDGLRGWGRVPE